MTLRRQKLVWVEEADNYGADLSSPLYLEAYLLIYRVKRLRTS